MFQPALDFADLLEHLVHGFGRRRAHFVVQAQHFLFRLDVITKGRLEDLADGLAVLQGAHLVQVAYPDFAGPQDLPLVGNEMVRNEVEKRRFAFAVGPDDPDMFPFLQFEGHIVQDRPPAEGIADMIDI